jgi:DNA invertase Pin-like site-specific DNA recombinase
MNSVAQTKRRSSSASRTIEGTKRTRGTVVYMRVSTEEQRERQTIENQRQFGERYAELHEIPIADWYADDGVTGMMPLADRGEGGRLLEDARRSGGAVTT